MNTVTALSAQRNNGQGDEPLLSAVEIAEYLGYAVSTIRNKCSAGDMPYERVGKRGVGFRKSVIDRWMEQRPDLRPGRRRIKRQKSRNGSYR